MYRSFLVRESCMCGRDARRKMPRCGIFRLAFLYVPDVLGAGAMLDGKMPRCGIFPSRIRPTENAALRHFPLGEQLYNIHDNYLQIKHGEDILQKLCTAQR